VLNDKTVVNAYRIPHTELILSSLPTVTCKCSPSPSLYRPGSFKPFTPNAVSRRVSAMGLYSRFYSR